MDRAAGWGEGYGVARFIRRISWKKHDMRDVKILQYSDHVSSLFLWQKAFTLAPLWAFLLLPFLGSLLWRLGDVAIQMGYCFLLAFFMARFTEDLLKCKIRVEKDILFFGYKTFELAELASVGLEYKENHVLPHLVVLNFKSSKKLKLKISRLKAEDLDWLLKYIETKHPSVNIDPTLRTLSKCKKLARNTSLETDNAVEIPYASRRIFRQLNDTFRSTADKWTRMGPLLTCIAFSPLWLSMITYIFLCFTNQIYSITQRLLMKKALDSVIEKTHGTAAAEVEHFGRWFAHLMENPLMAVFMTLTLMGLLYYLARFAFRPNVIMMTKEALILQLRIRSLNVVVGKVPCTSISNAYLKKPANSADSDKWKIVFNRSDGRQPFELSLGALATDDRMRFLKALERWAPHCVIDSELVETMMPRQERSYTELWLQSLSAPPERKSLEPLGPTQTLQDGKYEVLRRLGVGGQGLAYLCHDASENDVVLKETILPVFVENTVRQQALERFQQEAKLLESIQHEGIVQLLDYFIEDHRGYLVLEHINGKTLRELVQLEGPLNEEQACDLAKQMCEILAYLHERGIIHRDFTPDNLILRNDGRLKLIDFNVAQHTQDGATGTIVGKHAYLPPEQFRGKANNQSDLYAMGSTLFYILTGKDPEPITQSRPSQANIPISEEFDNFVATCTELNCKRRIKDAGEALHVLGFADTEEDASIIVNLKQEEKDAISL